MESAERLCNQIALIDSGRAVLSGSLASIKEKFGNNTIQLEFDGDGGFLESAPGVERLQRYERFVEINLAPGAQPQELLQRAAERLQVRRFEVMEPTLHNIFIDQVGQSAEVDDGSSADA
jgi:ABC-2 type transport system ATP-binding protein